TALEPVTELGPAPSPAPSPAPAAAVQIPDQLLIRPGEGVGPVRLGVSSPEEVLAAYGRDCRVERNESGIVRIDYGYDQDWNYLPHRAGSAERPALFEFREARLRRIAIAAPQTGLLTAQGVGIQSPKDEVVRAFGDSFRLT